MHFTVLFLYMQISCFNYIYPPYYLLLPFPILPHLDGTIACSSSVPISQVYVGCVDLVLLVHMSVNQQELHLRSHM